MQSARLQVCEHQAFTQLKGRRSIDVDVCWWSAASDPRLCEAGDELTGLWKATPFRRHQQERSIEMAIGGRKRCWFLTRLAKCRATSCSHEMGHQSILGVQESRIPTSAFSIGLLLLAELSAAAISPVTIGMLVGLFSSWCLDETDR